METINSFLHKNRITIRGMMVAFIILVLMIPMANISNLVQEREGRQREVSKEISSRWAADQTINGPVLIIPYLELSPQRVMEKKLAYFLASDLNIDVMVKPQVRRRSIYEIIVYQAQIHLTGTFDKLNIQNLNILETNVLWDEAYLCLGLTDFRGIEDQISMQWDTATAVPYHFEVGAASNDFIQNGLKINLPYGELAKSTHAFDILMNIKGSENISFIPTGKTTTVSMNSTWPHPSFTGAFLPAEQAKITSAGFAANWKVLDLNRNFPQQFKDTKYELSNASFGVNFLQGADLYTKTSRSVKYAFLFIALTLGLYFFMDIFQQKKVHAFQYVLIGLALCIFYTLLLSISEYLNFDSAYLIASLAIIVMVAVYTGAVFESKKIAGMFSGVLILLYAFIYVLIQLQDWALLLGSIGLFAVLAGVMFYSRKIDWKEEA